MVVSAEEREAIRAHVEAEYAAGEACGVIMARGDERRLLRCRNLQNELHAKDPARHPRDARTAYFIDPRDLLHVGRLEGEGFGVAVIYHSHVDAGAYFSETDRRQALMGDEPAYPHTTYLVASVVAGRLTALAAFRWDAGCRDFAPVSLDGAALSSEGAT